MFIQSNSISLNAFRNWNIHNNKMGKALARISSGSRINSAADDPAGFAILERMKAQIRMLQTEQNTVSDHMSMLNVADGTMGEMNEMLNRMLELANRATNGTFSETERKNMNEEYQQLLDEINRLGKGSEFNSKSLFQGSQGSSKEKGLGESQVSITYQGGNLEAFLDGLDDYLLKISNAARIDDQDTLLSLGIDTTNGKSHSDNLRDAVNKFTQENAGKLLNSPGADKAGTGNQYEIILSGGNIIIQMPKIDEKALGLGDTDLLSQSNASSAADAVKEAIKKISSWRGEAGANYNRLEHTMNSLSNMEVNLTDALSRILDTDMAKEMMVFVKEKALAQAAMFAMAQANQEPQKVLSLLKSI